MLRLLSLLLLTLVACTSPERDRAEPADAASGGLDSLGLPRTLEVVWDTTLSTPLSGELGAPVPLRIYRIDSVWEGYAIASASGIQFGPGIATQPGTLQMRLADLNFDGWADLWVKRYEHQRATGSDVWLYVPDYSSRPGLGFHVEMEAPGYVLSSELSRLPNLGVDLDAERLVSGISNCGCAGSCFYAEVYRWEEAQLVMEKRLYNECKARDFQYRVWERQGGALRLTTDRRIPFANDTDEDLMRRRGHGLRPLF